MEIKLYNTTSSNNTINKELSDEATYEVQFRGEADVLNPEILLKEGERTSKNYAYIPDFERFYFVKDIIAQRNNLSRLILEVDVLESFKDEILACKGVVSKHLGHNPYYNGGDYPSEVRKTHDIYDSDVTLEFEENIILVTIGG